MTLMRSKFSRPICLELGSAGLASTVDSANFLAAADERGVEWWTLWARSGVGACVRKWRMNWENRICDSEENVSHDATNLLFLCAYFFLILFSLHTGRQKKVLWHWALWSVGQKRKNRKKKFFFVILMINLNKFSLLVGHNYWKKSKNQTKKKWRPIIQKITEESISSHW